MRITANQITIARILLLPIPCGLVLHGTDTSLLVALVLGGILGFTDAVDGMLARKHGPTVLGSLLDPVADKIFVAAFVLPLSAMGYCPPWVAAGIFLRELLVSGLRSAMSERQTTLKTSVLGKMKTIVQMGGLMVFYFVAFVPTQPMKLINAIAAAVFVLLFFVEVIRKRTWPKFWITGTAPLWSIIALFAWFAEKSTAILVVFVIMLAFTWLSGIDYVIGAWRVLRQEGTNRKDYSRVNVAFAYAFVIVAVLYKAPFAVIPILIALAGALALFGIDNIVAAEERRPTKGSFLIGALGCYLVGALVLASGSVMPGMPAVSVWAITTALAAVQVIITLRAFFLDKHLFTTGKKLADTVSKMGASDD